MKKLFHFLTVTMFCILLHFNSFSQHFQTVWANNPYMPMSILVDSARLDSMYLQQNDEIAVYDVNAAGEEICVGYVVLPAEFLPDDNFMIKASADDPTTPEQDGFIEGHNIIYRFWDNSEAAEINLFNCLYNPAMSIAYQELGTALVGLDGFFALIWMGDIDNNWHNAANWNVNNLIPDIHKRVVIPLWCTSFPIISLSDASCQELKIEEGAMLTVTGNHSLLIED